MDIEDCDGDLAEIEQIAESRANIAATEVGDDSPAEVIAMSTADTTDIMNATIERCAQICDYERDDLAARIRALKDKP